MTLSISGARQFTAQLLEAAGVPSDNAAVTAEAVVLADVWGAASHGLSRLPFYLERIAAGGYPAKAELITVTDTGPVVTFDGGGGLGHWQLSRAARLAVERCESFGVAAIGVGNSGHCGALGVYTLPALRAGQLCLVFSNGPAVMPPWGGTEPLLSTSPLAAGIPSRPKPAIVDLASSTVARGRIAAYAKRGEALPDGWAFDGHGRPTRDPQEALAGMLAPLGGAKGFALALVVEAMSGALVGPALSADVTDMFRPAQAGTPQRIGHLVISLKPSTLDVEGGKAAQARFDELARRIEAAGGRLPGSRRVLPDEIDPQAVVILPAQLEVELGVWAERLGVPTRG